MFQVTERYKALFFVFDHLFFFFGEIVLDHLRLSVQKFSIILILVAEIDFFCLDIIVVMNS